MRKLVVLLALVIAASIAWWYVERSAQDSASAASVSAGVLPASSGTLVEPGSEATTRDARAPQVEDAELPVATPAIASATLVVFVVTAEDGAALPLATVGVRRSSDPERRPATTGTERGTVEVDAITNAEGRATIELPAATECVLSVHHSAMREAAKAPIAALQPGEIRELRVDMRSPNAGVARMRVVEEVSRAPIAGAEVAIVRLSPSKSIERPTGNPDRVLARTLTDADGRAEIPFAPWRGGVVRVDALGFGRRIGRLDTGLLRLGSEVELPLARGTRLEVRAPGIAALSNAELVVAAQTRELTWIPDTDIAALGGAQVWRLRADSDESCAFADLPPSTNLWLYALKDGAVVRRMASPVRLEPGATLAVEFPLASSATVRVHVRLTDGSAAAGVELALVAPTSIDSLYVQDLPSERAGSSRARTDASGDATFDSVAPGDWFLVPCESENAARDQRVAPLATLVRVAPEDRELSVELVLARGLFVRGSVRDLEERPVAWESVHLLSDDGAFQCAADTDADGRFEIGPLPTGRFRIAAGGTQTPLGEALDVEAPADGIVLHTGTAGTLRVRFVDDRQERVFDAQVLVSRGGPAGRGFAWWLTALGDGVDLRNKSAGTWDVLATTEQGLVGAESVLVLEGAGGAPATLVLSPGARLTLLHAPPTGRCIATQGTRWVGLTWLRPGSAPQVVVPAGHTRLTLVGTGEASERVLELDAISGETREIDLSLAR